MVGKGSATTELLYGMLSGMAFGLISPVFAKPFDCIKTKMQGERRFSTGSARSVFSAVVRELGVSGLFRGMLPILASTGVQKTVLFAANSGARRACERSSIRALDEAIPFSAGLKPAVLIGGVAAAAARTVVETPFELTKVRWQTGGSVVVASGLRRGVPFAQVREMYTGGGATFVRAALMLGTFFALCDYTERFATSIAAQPLVGGFFKGGVCATFSWLVCWPFEVAKSRIQSAEGKNLSKSAIQVIREIATQEGALCPARAAASFIPLHKVSERIDVPSRSPYYFSPGFARDSVLRMLRRTLA
jgi:solute carrier family 25 carnitine/acylcarnitine transporter 20/29